MTSTDEVIAPGTYNLSTRYRYDIVRVATNSSRPDEVLSTGNQPANTARPSITLKLGYRYQIDATTGVVTPTAVLTMD